MFSSRLSTQNWRSSNLLASACHIGLMTKDMKPTSLLARAWKVSATMKGAGRRPAPVDARETHWVAQVGGVEQHAGQHVLVQLLGRGAAVEVLHQFEVPGHVGCQHHGHGQTAEAPLLLRIQAAQQVACRAVQNLEHQGAVEVLQHRLVVVAPRQRTVGEHLEAVVGAGVAHVVAQAANHAGDLVEGVQLLARLGLEAQVVAGVLHANTVREGMEWYVVVVGAHGLHEGPQRSGRHGPSSCHIQLIQDEARHALEVILVPEEVQHVKVPRPQLVALALQPQQLRLHRLCLPLVGLHQPLRTLQQQGVRRRHLEVRQWRAQIQALQELRQRPHGLQLGFPERRLLRGTQAAENPGQLVAPANGYGQGDPSCVATAHHRRHAALDIFQDGDVVLVLLLVLLLALRVRGGQREVACVGVVAVQPCLSGLAELRQRRQHRRQRGAAALGGQRLQLGHLGGPLARARVTQHHAGLRAHGLHQALVIGVEHAVADAEGGLLVDGLHDTQHVSAGVADGRRQDGARLEAGLPVYGRVEQRLGVGVGNVDDAACLEGLAHDAAVHGHPAATHVLRDDALQRLRGRVVEIHADALGCRHHAQRLPGQRFASPALGQQGALAEGHAGVCGDLLSYGLVRRRERRGLGGGHFVDGHEDALRIAHGGDGYGQDASRGERRPLVDVPAEARVQLRVGHVDALLRVGHGAHQPVGQRQAEALLQEQADALGVQQAVGRLHHAHQTLLGIKISGAGRAQQLLRLHVAQQALEDVSAFGRRQLLQELDVVVHSV
eukprot:scaffold2893_cov254-Pinguiococcus_pyrenoidosus.AAC.32